MGRTTPRRMKRQIKLAIRDYTLAGLVILPGFLVSFVLLTVYLLKLSDRCQSMHVILPTHLVIILGGWIKWCFTFPWSALLTITPFIIFEFVARMENKATVRQVVLLILVLVSLSINALTAWSVVDIQDQLLNHTQIITE